MLRSQNGLIALLAVLALVISACQAEEPADSGLPDSEPPASQAAESVEPAESEAAGDGVVVFEPGQDFTSTLLPKCTSNAVFVEANEGAQEAAAELEADPAEFVGPAECGDPTQQIEFVTNATTQGVDAIMISNNAGDELAPSVTDAAEAGIVVTTWDSPIPSGEGESVFVAQVDFDETGQVMADMALSLLGADGGQFAILSATPEAANQNAWIAAMEEVLQGDDYSALELVETVYGNDDPEDSYEAALGLVDSHPDLELIMAPTTVGIREAAKAMQDEGLCGEVLVSGLGLPSEMREYTEAGCAPEFALWSFADLGYLTYYVSYGLATGQIEAAEGVRFEAGRLGEYTIEDDPTRDTGLRVLMGPFTVYNAENIGD